MIIRNEKLPEYTLSESLKFVEPLVFSNLEFFFLNSFK